jgi:hypothetical protein
LRETLQRAERLAGTLLVPTVSHDAMVEAGKRRQVRARVEALAVSLIVVAAAGMITWSLAGIDRSPGVPSSRSPATERPSPSASSPPTGVIHQRTVDGHPAQTVGPFLLGVAKGPSGSCIQAQPLAQGPSWTWSDNGHDCVERLGHGALRAGRGSGVISPDGGPGGPVRYWAIYGRVSGDVAQVEVVWTDGSSALVRPAGGMFLLGLRQDPGTTRIVARAGDGSALQAVELGG